MTQLSQRTGSSRSKWLEDGDSEGIVDVEVMMELGMISEQSDIVQLLLERGVRGRTVLLPVAVDDVVVADVLVATVARTARLR